MLQYVYLLLNLRQALTSLIEDHRAIQKLINDCAHELLKKVTVVYYYNNVPSLRAK